MTADAAGFDYIFVPDGPTHDADRFPRNPFRTLEALTLVTSLVGITQNIGLIPSISTTFFEPFNVARQIASLDHLSSGRAGWNVVTSYGGAEHYHSNGLLEHDLRYERAEEFLEIVDLFWRSWSSDALVIDRESGVWGDPHGLDRFEYDGGHFQVRGPANIPAPLQGRPVIAQAGGSDPGRNLGARHADLIYASGLPLHQAQQFYADVKRRAEAFGRSADDIRVVPGVTAIIGDTETEAKRIDAELYDLIDPIASRHSLEWMLGDVDLSGFDIDKPIPTDAFPESASTNRVQSHIDHYKYLALERRLTIRELIRYTVRGGGSLHLIGTAEQVADVLQQRFENGAADGFTFSPAYVPEGFQAIAERLLPELVARGIFDGVAEGSTLRERLQLSEPKLSPVSEVA